MFIYMVVPSTMKAQALEAKAGWRVFLALISALNDLEERFQARERQKYHGAWTGYSMMAFDPVVIQAEIPDEKRLADGLAGRYLLWEAVRSDEPMLVQPVRSWRRVTQEDFLIWEVEQALSGFNAPRFAFKERWFNQMPPTSEVPPKPVEYRNEGRARPDQKGIIRRKVRARAGQ